MKSIETTAQFNEDGTVTVTLNSHLFRPGKHKIILILDEESMIDKSF